MKIIGFPKELFVFFAEISGFPEELSIFCQKHVVFLSKNMHFARNAAFSSAKVCIFVEIVPKQKNVLW